MRTIALTTLVLDISKARKKDDELLDFLRERGMQPKTMRDPRRASDHLRRGAAQVLLLNVGRRCSHPPAEVLRRLRKANPDVPIIVVTPQPQLDEAILLVRERAYDYISRKQLAADFDEALDRIIADKGYALSAEERLTRTLGTRLREARHERNLTLKQLSTRTGLSSSLISQIERCKVSPSVATLLKLSKALRQRLQDLFAGH